MVSGQSVLLSQVCIRLLSVFIVFAVMFAGCSQPDHATIKFHGAIERGDLAVVKQMVEEGISPEITDTVGRTPLYVAALYREPKIVEYLLSRGANPSNGVSSKAGRTPLHAAAQVGDNGVVEIFLKRGVDPNIGDRRQVTPLHEAAWNLNTETAAILLTYGAAPNIRDKVGYPPSIPRWDFPDKLSPDKFPKYRRILDVLFEHGMNINMCDVAWGMTPLIYAAFIGDVETVKFLLSKGADASIKSRLTEDGTALSVAKREGYKDIVIILDSLRPPK